MINSNEKNKIIRGYLLIGENRDTTFVESIFKNLDDQRISHDYSFKGVSVYQSKMIAIKKISGIPPPKKINYKKDDSIINFYRKWATENNLLDSHRLK